MALLMVDTHASIEQLAGMWGVLELCKKIE